MCDFRTFAMTKLIDAMWNTRTTVLNVTNCSKRKFGLNQGLKFKLPRGPHEDLPSSPRPGRNERWQGGHNFPGAESHFSLQFSFIFMVVFVVSFHEML